MKAAKARYRHLTDAGIEYVVIDGIVDDVIPGDLVLDGTMWVRGMGSDAALGTPSVRLELEAWTGQPGVTGALGRLSMTTGSEIRIARPVAPPAAETPEARLDPATSTEGASRTAPTINLAAGDRVILYGDVAEIKDAHKNGLLIFVGGDAYQSRPNLFWGVV